MTACEQDNLGREVDLTQTVTLVSPDALVSVGDDPALVGRVLEFLRPVRPLRLCDPDSIDVYFSSGGTEGVLLIDWPAHIAEFLAEHPL